MRIQDENTLSEKQANENLSGNLADESFRVPKIACINDFSGYGRCSLAVALPVLSVCGVQCCSLPTAVFSNHTGFESFFKHDLTDDFPQYEIEWEKLALEFDGIYSGYLGSFAQVKLVSDFINRFKKAHTLVIVDPVMGDDGKLYKSFSEDTARGLKKLASKADILTPNLTEACFLADMKFTANPSDMFLSEVAGKIMTGSCKSLVITGIESEKSVKNFIVTDSGSSVYEVEKRVPSRSGTGDVFASVIAASAIRGRDFAESVKIAADFVKLAAERSHELRYKSTEGAAFEPFLYRLGESFEK